MYFTSHFSTGTGPYRIVRYRAVQTSYGQQKYKSQAGIEPASPSLNNVNRKKFPHPASIEQMYRNLILDILGHIYRGQQYRYSNFDTLGSSIELNCDVKSDFSYDAYGTVPSIELNCDVKFGLISWFFYIL